MALGRGNEISVLTAGVIASRWPGWSTAFSMQRLALKWILLRDRTLVGLVKDAFPKVKVLLWEDTELSPLTAVDIVGFNGPLDEVHKPLPFGSLYIRDWETRHRWSGWIFSYETIQHVN